MDTVAETTMAAAHRRIGNILRFQVREQFAEHRIESIALEASVLGT